jgi:Ca-activated chloride channel family protein
MALWLSRDGPHDFGQDPVPDRARITPPVLHPAHEPSSVEGLRLPVNFDISLEAGVRLADISSQTHGLVVTRVDGDTAHISLKDGEVPADRDFVLSVEAGSRRDADGRACSVRHAMARTIFSPW